MFRIGKYIYIHIYIYIYICIYIYIYIYTESRLVLAYCRRGELGRNWECLNGYQVSFWGSKSVLKIDWVMVAKLCEYIKNHGIVHFKWVNCMLCELYLNKAVI